MIGFFILNYMEIWKDVVGYEKLYQVSDLGNIKGLRRCDNRGNLVREKVLKPCLSSGYLAVTLCKNNKRKTKRIHQLVAEAFLNHNASGRYIVVNHKNFIKTDNRVENLEIVTARENLNRKHIESRSKYTGVSWSTINNKWKSSIYINGKSKYLGCFLNEIDAHLAYEKELSIINEK